MNIERVEPLISNSRASGNPAPAAFVRQRQGEMLGWEPKIVDRRGPRQDGRVVHRFSERADGRAQTGVR